MDVFLDWSNLTGLTLFVLLLVLLAEAANGWTDAPCATSAAVATGVLSSRQALWVTVAGNFVGLLASLLVGAAVAHTIGTGIVRPEMITVASIGIAMLTVFLWSCIAAWLGLPVSKTHSLLAALAGIGFSLGGLEALTPASGDWGDSGWVKVGIGAFSAIVAGSALSWVVARSILTAKLEDRIPEEWWRRMQIATVCIVSSGHGFNDGLKYVGIFTLVLFTSGMIPEFTVLPSVIVLCAIVMGIGTFVGGWRIHNRLDAMVNHPVAEQVGKKSFLPFMGVSSELVSGFLIWQTGWLGIPTSTNHATVAAMAGARSSSGKVHSGSLIKILWGWVVTYIFCFWMADLVTAVML